ncbi:MAG: hypothetical protein HGA38_04950 [Candidatus Moranbacteria bacterium]|nr:hypothetical protein [Candidatus Moranbacteria bacterium]NTW46502.1 hypothetical protein [Candidatus Moranbacteria bacterium]
MTSSQRLIRRSKIAAVVILFLSLVGIGAYFALRTPPSCTDGRKNGGETGVDCGGSCGACPEVLAPEALVIREASVVPGNSASESDAVFKIYNPNDTIGASSVSYDVIFRDTGGSEIGRVSGVDSVLPQETKIVLAIGAAVSGKAVSADIVFRDAKWQRFSGYQERPRLSVYRTRFETVTSGAFYGQAIGTLRNESPYDFRTVTVKVVLRDSSGKPLSVNQTDLNTLLSGDVRDITLPWPSAFPGTVASVEAVADTDFYHQENFIGRYRDASQEFQSLR